MEGVPYGSRGMAAFARATFGLPIQRAAPRTKLCARRRRPAAPPPACVLRYSHGYPTDEQPTRRGGGANPQRPAKSKVQDLRRMALISDVHVFDREGIWNEDVTQFLGQRALGLLNIVALRGPSTYDSKILERALVDMEEEGVQHLVVAGDISNLSIRSEFALARRIFETSSIDMSFCPGNHDTYNRGQKDAAFFHEYFSDWCVSDLPCSGARKDGFPIAQIRGGVLFVILNTGLPNTARGAVGASQWEAAAAMLDTPQGVRARSTCRYTVLVMHHAAQNPSVRGTPWIREFQHDTKDWADVPEFCTRYNVDLVVHGHMHVPYRGVLADAPRTHVYESGSGTLVTENPARVARYTVFDISESGMLHRTYARVWDLDAEQFNTLELPVPALEVAVPTPVNVY